MNEVKKIIRERYEIIISIIHFLLSFTWQGSIFLKRGRSWEYFYTLVRDENVISADNEIRIVYLLSRIFCFLIILAFWKVVFYVIKGNVTKSSMNILGIIFIVGILFGIITFPNYFGTEIDNYANYLRAIRFQPIYWQSIYTGALYAGCLMVIPHPIAIVIVQWAFYWGVVSYIYLGFERLSEKSIYKYIVLVIFLLPESYSLAFNAYRNNYYTVMMLAYIAYIYFSIKAENREIGVCSIIGFSIYSSFLMVFRSEGVFIGICGIVIYLIYIIGIKKDRIKQISVLIIAVSIGFITLTQIQSIGEKKYFGKDYMILNTTSVLSNVLNNPQANFSYEGADGDWKAIDDIVPIQVLKEYGTDGYLSYNYAEGRRDFDQTLATDEQASAYMKAYFHVILHNLDSYLNVQRNCLYNALSLPANCKIYEYEGEHTVVLDGFEYDLWRDGQNEFMTTWHTASWESNQIRIILCNIVDNMINIWRDVICDSGINSFFNVGSLVLIVFLLLLELLRIIDKKCRLMEVFPFVIAFTTIIIELGVVMLFMPEGRPQYLFPMLYSSYFMIFIYFFETMSGNKAREK